MTEITVGKSGAKVYDLDGTRIFKHVIRDKIENGMFDTYVREAQLYKALCPKPYLPELETIEIYPDEIKLVMKKYMHPDRNSINEDTIRKVADVLFDIHLTEIPEFMQNDEKRAALLTEDEIKQCLDGWNSVFGEHPGVFDALPLNAISENINDIITRHDSESKVLSHGDFHFDNLLTDENGNIIVCDWQGVNVGGASSDISFFMSRLGADGIQVDGRLFLESYVDAVNRKTGAGLAAKDIEWHIQASNIITTFRYWHFYLHGNPADRVQEIYGKMAEDYKLYLAFSTTL